jgi:hypothetical protein
MSACIEFVLLGGLPSGKNQVGIAVHNGKVMRFPNKRFKLWRVTAWEQVRAQRVGKNWTTLEVPASITVEYWPGDRICRDVPGMMDAICHVLEHCPICKPRCHCQLPVVRNDKLLVNWSWRTMELDRSNPRANIRIEVL